MIKRLFITGSESCTDLGDLEGPLNELISCGEVAKTPATVTGFRPGAERMGLYLAKSNGWPQAMEADGALVVWDGRSRESLLMIKRMVAQGKPVWVHIVGRVEFDLPSGVGFI